MRKNQNGFTWPTLLLVLVVATIGVGGWYIWQKQNNSAINSNNESEQISSQSSAINTPRQNKEIEIQAAKDKDPAKCEEIKGESYYIGPRDEKVPVSETEAKQQCLDNIQNGVIPVLFGG